MSIVYKCPIPAFEGPTKGVIMPLEPYHVVKIQISTNSSLMARLELTNAQFLLLKAKVKEL